MRDLLSMTMQLAVPLNILRFKENGGPTQEDIINAQVTSDLLGEHGDLLLYGGKPRKLKNGELLSCADLFNKTAKAIAVISFCPGGVTIFGSTFEAKDLWWKDKKKRVLTSSLKLLIKNIRRWKYNESKQNLS